MKKVLVIDIDMYSQCYCYLHRLHHAYADKNKNYCNFNGMEVEFDTISSNCPLKDLPTKLESPSYAHESYYHYDKGYNDCLSEIEKGK